ncbi:T-lymphocyte surface antigen Ly-9-like [Salminus brasiliensis]|uniref:T-lymphocyte surface antigen Ly-9-like n=1 Tax=Salminus brasiliensis TaxID=930266 RepID=UPI003B834CAE
MTICIWFFVYAVVVKAVVRDEAETVEVAEGSTITLINLSRKKTGDVILWTFGTADTIIAQLVNRESVTITGERFGNRLQLDRLTGSLTIRNIRMADSGVYKVQIISLEILTKDFRVAVYDPVSVPTIKNISEISECQTPEDQSMQLQRTSIGTDRASTSDLCTVLCSVSNGPQVSLSWTKGRETLKQSSNPDLSVPLCLPLEIQDIQDKVIYSCVAANPVSNQSSQLNITEVCPQAVLEAAVSDNVERVEVTEGSSVTLTNDLSGIQSDFVIQWTFGATDACIAVLFGRDNLTHFDPRFRDRLLLDTLTGSLTISNITSTHSGRYKVLISSDEISTKYFIVTVYAPVSKPVIRHFRSGNRSESCSPVCSVEKGEDVTLSWYEEKERISSISRSDSSERLHLPLNRTFPNSYTYTCESANPVSHQTTQLNIAELCDFNSGQSSVHCCGSLEFMVRLVLSAVMVLATGACEIKEGCNDEAHLGSPSLLLIAGEEAVRLQELEGNTVTIHTGLTGVQSHAQILWYYGLEDADVLIVISLAFKGEANTEYTSDRFRDRLQLDRLSGSLTIRNISREDSGVYTLQIITEIISVWRFRVKVYSQSSVHCCGSVELMVRLVLSAVMVLATVAVLLSHFTSRTVSDGGLHRKRHRIAEPITMSQGLSLEYENDL